MKLLFVVNPISGGVDKEPFLQEAMIICKDFKVDFHVFKTTGKEDEKHLKEALQKFKPDKVAAVGGDGTVLFASIILLNTSVPIGIIPLGSANGMAKELNINNEPVEALKDILNSIFTIKLDMLIVNEKHHLMHIGDVGLNAKIIESYDKDDSRGMLTYAKYFIEELGNIDPFEIEIDANGYKIKQTGVMATICNFRKYGTGVPLNIEGNPTDGQFEIVIIKGIDTSAIVKASLSIFDESFYDDENTVKVSTKKAKIKFNEPRLLQIDGEIIGKFDLLNINIIPAGITLITTHTNLFSNENH